MTRTQAAKLLGILHDRSRWWIVQNAAGRELLFNLGKLNLKMAAGLQKNLNADEWHDAQGNFHAIAPAEREKAPGVILRLVQSADAHFTLAGK